MKNCLQIVTAAALLLTASFGLRNLMTPATAAASTQAAITTGTGGPVPPALSASFAGPGTSPDICTGTGGPVPPGCFAAKVR